MVWLWTMIFKRVRCKCDDLLIRIILSGHRMSHWHELIVFAEVPAPDLPSQRGDQGTPEMYVWGQFFQKILFSCTLSLTPRDESWSVSTEEGDVREGIVSKREMILSRLASGHNDLSNNKYYLTLSPSRRLLCFTTKCWQQYYNRMN